tara:strand:- start:271 stop:492 length:222 start_codon:yes stop_codon:yes gene_type:complete
MKIFVSTSIITLLAISAAAGVMPEEIPSTANTISQTVEMASGAEVNAPEMETTFKTKLDEFFHFAFTALIIFL